MNAHADKAQENKNQTVADSKSQKMGSEESMLQFRDKRAKPIAQRKLQAIANNSPQNSRQQSFQFMANKSHQMNWVAQFQTMANNHAAENQQPFQNIGNSASLQRESNTGLPNKLKTGIENLSGISMDDVKVHRNSSKPAQLQAHAYAQGANIHLGPGQERHLPHEAWHVVQQKQGRVKPTMQMKSKVNVNDDVGLEKEADLMGEKALRMDSTPKKTFQFPVQFPLVQRLAKPEVIQRVTSITHTYSYVTPDVGDKKTNYKVGRKVVAKLDPSDPVKGSSTGAHWDWMGLMREEYGSLVKGHLLNHDLGGFAKEENLYPITSKANQEHSAVVEQNVKRALFERPKKEDRRLHYEVTVGEKNAHDPKIAWFDCWWGWESGYFSKAEKLGEARIDSVMKKGDNYGGFKGTPPNHFPMKGGNKTAEAWFHGPRSEEQDQVNKDWVGHQNSWYGNKIGVSGAWDTYSRNLNIKNADKTTRNVVPKTIANNRVAMDVMGDFMGWFKHELAQREFDYVFASVFEHHIEKALMVSLETGEGKAKNISYFIQKNGPKALGGKLKEILGGISIEIFKVITDTESQLDLHWNKKSPFNRPKSPFIKSHWDDEDKRIVESAKSEIFDAVEIAIDKAKWT